MFKSGSSKKILSFKGSGLRKWLHFWSRRKGLINFHARFEKTCSNGRFVCQHSGRNWIERGEGWRTTRGSLIKNRSSWEGPERWRRGFSRNHRAQRIANGAEIRSTICSAYVSVRVPLPRCSSFWRRNAAATHKLTALSSGFCTGASTCRRWNSRRKYAGQIQSTLN